MRHAAWILLLLMGATASGQSGPDGNTAAQGAKKHLESLKLPFNLFDPPKPAPPKLGPQKSEGIPLAAAKPALCAIPLLNVKPGPVKDRMPIVKPPVSALQESRELKLQVPAPACDEQLFQHK